jgi:cellobiose phosphorylase
MPMAHGSIHRIASPSGLAASFNANGSLRELRWGDELCVHLFPGNALEAGSTQLVLRRWAGMTPEGGPDILPLLGPHSPARWHAEDDRLVARGDWQGLAFELSFVLAANEPAWFWHLSLHHARGNAPCTVDLICQHDIALAPHGALRLNEYYVCHYVDLTPLEHAEHGRLLAVRQNQAVAGRHPWALIGSLRRANAFATDAMQTLGLDHRFGAAPQGWRQGLADRRLQQEQAMAALQDAPLSLAPGERAVLGFFGGLQANHPAASGPADAAWADQLLAQPEAAPPGALPPAALQAVWQPPRPSLFSHAARLTAHAFDETDCDAHFGPQRTHEERGPDGALWSFFTPDGEHVVLPAKERAVLRPHGHLLRSGEHLVPDEAAMTSTCWMGGTFHSMVTQGHVSINRLLSTVHGTLGQFRSQGQRVFVRRGGHGGDWQLLDQPSAFAMGERRARWWYRDDHGLLEVVAAAATDRPELTLHLRFLDGPPADCLVTHHLALNGDDGEVPGRVAVHHRADGGLWLAPPAGTPLHERFPRGGFVITPDGADSRLLEVAGAEAVFQDGEDHDVPLLCLHFAAAPEIGLRIRGELVEMQAAATPTLATLQPPRLSSTEGHAAALSTALPWFQHNALVHYLAPRGLEQYSGGGWGTRDVCQGPAELLLAQGSLVPLRDLLRRVFMNQNPDGDWPQWFMFFERERAIRAGDSHGDIVFWPLFALGQYLLASSDAALLDEVMPFHAAAGQPPEHATLWQHVERALSVIAGRRIAGTALAAYGHGDWNDSLQPADPRLRDQLCSSWTVTLHTQVLKTLADAFGLLGQAERAEAFHQERLQVQADFRRWLMPSAASAPDAPAVLTGYALFDTPGQPPEPLLHPADRRTGVRYSLLPMIHAVLADLLTPDEADAHFALIEQHLLGPDGARLFDTPLPYRGGPQQLFQRAESSSYFGREIGLMYTHAHLRYAEALAHLGRAEAFWRALNQAHPVDLRQRVPSAAPRQANCYYSSSDAAFADRYQAGSDYLRSLRGDVPLEGGWRVYSSGAGIALALVQRSLLGLRPRADACVIDPVIASSLGALQAETTLAGRRVSINCEIGARGHGVLTAELNGTILPFTLEPNPYREGGARIDWAEMAPAWQPGLNSLRLFIA